MIEEPEAYQQRQAQPIYREFSDEATMSAWFEQSFGTKNEILARLTDAERSAVTAYQGASYSSINEQARGQQPATEMILEWIRGLSSASSKHKLKEPIVAHRGTLIPEISRAIDANQNLVGIEFEDLGFASTSLNQNVTRGFNWRPGSVNLKIKLPEGCSVIPLSGAEHELLLPAGTRFRVVDVGEWIANPNKPNTKITQLTVEIIK